MPQTGRMIEQQSFQPAKFILSNVPFYPQKKYQCGPAALAAVLNAAPQSIEIRSKKQITPDELVSQVYVPERKGSFQLEMIAATRRYNLVPYVLKPDMSVLFREVQAGNPVLVLVNQSFDWAPVWHYAVVVGFDITKRIVLLHSGVDKYLSTDMSTFERTWKRANYWAMVALPSNEVPHTANVLEYIKAVSKFDVMKKYDISIASYKAALERWPGNLTLHLAIGNSYFKLGQLDNASEVLREAVKLYPKSAVAHNNLAYVLYKQGKIKAAQKFALEAVRLDGNNSSDSQKTLDEINSHPMFSSP